MSAALRMKVGVCAAGLSYLLVVGYAQAQQVEEQIKPAQYADQNTGQPIAEQAPGQRTTTHFRGPDAAGSTVGSATQAVDHYLANCLLIKNEAEIEISEFATDRADSPQVKQFAEQMVKDHRQLVEKLARVARTNQGAASGQTNLQTRAIGSDATINRLLEIDRQITDHCVEMAREKLGQKSGTEFDKCFVGAQVGSHMQMLSALDVISQQAGGELRQIAQHAKPQVETHLKRAEQLAKQLEAGSQADRQARAE